MKNPTCPICDYSLEQEAEKDLASGAAKPAAYSVAYLTHFQTVHPDFWQWEQSKRRIGLGLGAVTATATGVLIFYILALVLKVNGSDWGRVVAGICTVAFVIPFALINRRGAEHFKAQWQAEGKLPTPTPRVGLDQAQDSVVAEDPSILGLTSDLARNLGIHDLAVSQLQWKSTIAQGRSISMVPSDAALFRGNTMYLAENMEGKLSLDQWKPLLASALNYHKLRWQKIFWILSITIPVIAVDFIGWLLLPPLYPTTTSCAYGKCAVNNTGWDILIIPSLILPIVLLIFFALTWRRFRFIADKHTATSIGKDQLVNSLRRVLEVSPYSLLAQKRIDKLNQQ